MAGASQSTASSGQIQIQKPPCSITRLSRNGYSLETALGWQDHELYVNVQYFSEAMPPEERNDIDEWERIRGLAVEGTVSSTQLEATMLYHYYLQDIVPKLPDDVLTFTYTAAFEKGSTSTHSSLVFEHAAVLFNIAASLSQLAQKQDNPISSCSHYQKAAGYISYLNDSKFLRVLYSVSREEVALEFSECFLVGLQQLMIAQAQKWAWRKATSSGLKHGLVSKLAMKASSLYGGCMLKIKDISSSDPQAQRLVQDWVRRIECNRLFLEAHAHHSMSICEFDAARYGTQIAHLEVALDLASKALSTIHGNDDENVVEVISGFVNEVKFGLLQATQANLCIYYAEVPISLPSLEEQLVVRVDTPAGLANPESTRHLFGETLSIGVQMAIADYEKRKSAVVLEITMSNTEIQRNTERKLNALCLPEALEANETTCGLPPHLLEKVDELRCADGPNTVEELILTLEELARTCSVLLLKAQDMLGNELLLDASTYRSNFQMRTSHQTHADLVERQNNSRCQALLYRNHDEVLRADWRRWEPEVTRLTSPKDELQASFSCCCPFDDVTQYHRAELRILLAQLDACRQNCNNLVSRVQRVANDDDIKAAAVVAASLFERRFEVKPQMLSLVCDKQFERYSDFVQGIIDYKTEQEEVCDKIEYHHSLFMKAQQNNPLVLQHTENLRALELAFHTYQNIRQRLGDRIMDYEDMKRIVFKFVGSCETWAENRQLEMHAHKGTLDEYLRQRGNLHVALENKNATG